MSVFLLFIVSLVMVNSMVMRWSEEQAQLWQKAQGYRAGVNFVPSTAVNELEMFQKETYDPVTIDRELQYMQSVGFNTARVFLHNILYDEGAEDFYARLDDFLSLTDKRDFKVMFVLLDSCWNAYPTAGTQPEPIPGVHNSQWVQSPGLAIMSDAAKFSQLEGYIKGVTSRFRNDQRILAWDVWNEPNNSGYNDDVVYSYMEQIFTWIRAVSPSQPLTTPIWQGLTDPNFTKLQQLQMDLSDVISFHDYEDVNALQTAVQKFKAANPNRPIICTEYMARTAGSTFEPHLAYMVSQNVYAYNWGLVSGRTQTIYPWSTTTVPATQEPAVWFHDMFRADGVPFNSSEVAYIQSLLHPLTKKN